jgi:hypothetical protein
MASGVNDIQFAEGLRITYTDLVQQAGIDEATTVGDALATAERGYASTHLRQQGGAPIHPCRPP